MDKDQGQTTVTPREARSGYLDRPVLLVLIASLVLIVVIFAVLWGVAII